MNDGWAALIFDLDGTLVDTVETRIAAWARTFQEIGLRAGREQLAPLIGSDGRRLARVVAEAAGRPIDAERAEEIDRRAGEIYEELNTDPRPLPGARGLLTALDTERIPWAIATSSRREQVTASIRSLRLARPPVIVDGTHVAHAKPAPDVLLLAAERLDVEPRRALYVGDSVWDMLAARAAGMPAAGVTTGSASADQLAEAGAALTIASLAELIPRVRARKASG